MSTLRDRVRHVVQHAPLQFALLFGSRAQGTALPMSDVDVAVYMEDMDTFLDLVVQLEEEVAPLRVDVVNLKGKPAPFYYNVLSSGELLVVKDKRFLQDERLRVMREYLDFKPVEERIKRDMYKRIADGTYGKRGGKA